jgi:argininosuccinate lyase
MAEATHPLVEAFTTSYPIDCRLYPYDIAGSIAHCRMLAKQRIIAQRDAQRIVGGLKAIKRELDSGAFRVRPQDEDIHMAVERRLIERIGPIGGKLHTARSRNDQVALDLRLYVRDAIGAIRVELAALQRALGKLARRHVDAVMPGFTHLQPAQPVLFAHHLLAYVEMLSRDDGRLADCLKRTDVLPLGSGALAGTTFPIDRAFVARQLGFAAISENSLDAVGDRDFAAELLATLAILGMHLSRFADEIVLWSSQQFAFVELPDAFATGSSMMPQKKNPDVAELVRGKTGRVVGALVALLTTLKGLPLTYNRDLQEDKVPLFDAAATLRASLEVLTAMLPALGFDTERMAAAADGLLLATDAADLLVERGVPFRKAHELVGALVRHCLATRTGLRELDDATLRRFVPQLEPAVVRRITPSTSVARRRVAGGTAPAEVRRQLARAAREAR